MGAMTTLRPAPISSRQLHFDANTNEWVGEISSTNGFGRVWNDSCDEGLTLVSADSGRETVFYVNRTIRNTDGDIAFWILAPVAEPGALPCTIRLFND